MRFLITYIAGFFSSVLIFSGIVVKESNLLVNLIIAVMVTIAAGVFCHKRHIKKRNEYYNRFSRKFLEGSYK